MGSNSVCLRTSRQANQVHWRRETKGRKKITKKGKKEESLPDSINIESNSTTVEISGTWLRLANRIGIESHDHVTMSRQLLLDAEDEVLLDDYASTQNSVHS